MRFYFLRNIFNRSKSRCKTILRIFRARINISLIWEKDKKSSLLICYGAYSSTGILKVSKYSIGFSYPKMEHKSLDVPWYYILDD